VAPDVHAATFPAAALALAAGPLCVLAAGGPVLVDAHAKQPAGVGSRRHARANVHRPG
jgi:hypothetical protein